MARLTLSGSFKEKTMSSKAHAQMAKFEASIQPGLRGKVLQRQRTALLEPDEAKEITPFSYNESRYSAPSAPDNPNLGHNFSRLSVFPSRRAALQTKLRIGKPNDIYEQEADRVADQVMRMPEPVVQRKGKSEDDEIDEIKEEKIQAKPLGEEITPLVQRQAGEGEKDERSEEGEEEKEEIVRPKFCENRKAVLIQRETDSEAEEGSDSEKKKEKEETVQSKRKESSAPAAHQRLADEIDSMEGQGRPLPSPTRACFEQRFGHDFSKVRIHADSRADNAAGNLNAHAFTRRQDIFFKAGYYQPHTETGQQLIAHELTHTIQQRTSPVSTIQRTPATAEAPPAAEIDNPFVEILPETTTTSGPDRKTPEIEHVPGNDGGPSHESTPADQALPELEGGKKPACTPEKETEEKQSAPFSLEEGKTVAAPAVQTGKGVEEKKNEGERAPVEAEKTAISAEDPGGILEQLKKVPPTNAAEAYGQAQEDSAAALEKQKSAVEQSLPVIPAPTGLPPKGTPGAKGQGQESTLKVKAPSTFKGEKTGKKGKEYKMQAVAAPPAPTIRPTRLAGGEAGPSAEGDLSKSAQNELNRIRLDAGRIATSAGGRPSIDVTGEADPSQIDSFQGESNINVQKAKAEASGELNRDFGEHDIFPETKPETLKSKKGLSAPKKIASQKGGSNPALPPEAIQGLNGTLGPKLSERIGEQKDKYDAGKADFERDSAKARTDADKQVSDLNRETRKQQIAEQNKAKAQAAQARKEGKAELDKADKDYREKAAKATVDQRAKIAREKQKGEAKAAQHLNDAEKKAEQEKLKAERNANQKREDAKKESKGFWGWAHSAASTLIDGLKKAVNFIYDNLRKAVKDIFEAAKTLVKAAIEVARRAIVGLIKAYGMILKGLVSVVFAAFPNIVKKINNKIDHALDAAVKAVNKAAELLKKGVEAVLDFLAKAIDSLLGLIQDLYNGLFTLIGMIIRGEFGELMKRLGNLVDAAKLMPDKFETAAYEELLGGNLDEPLSPAELSQAGITPPEPGRTGSVGPGESGQMPAPPWTEANVGVDNVENNMQLSPELAAAAAELTGKDGEVEFGQSDDADRTMGAVMAEATGERQGNQEIQQKYPDDGLTPMQRAEVKWKIMKQGLSAWWEENKVKIIAGAIAAIVGVIALIIVTGGGIFAAIAPLMSVLGPIFIGVTTAVLVGHVRDYVSKSWNEDVLGGAKSLAKGLAAGAVEVVSWLTFKAGGAALKGAKALAKGGIALARGAVKLLVRGAKFIIERGKVLFRGIAGSGIGQRLKNIAELGKKLLERLRFRKFRLRVKNSRFRIEGYINPWVLLATGEIEYIEKSLLKKRLKRRGPLQVGYKVETKEGVEGIVVGITKKGDETAKRFVEEVLRPHSQEELIRLYKQYENIPKDRLKVMLELVSRETSENAAKLRKNMGATLGKELKPGEHAHHIVPSTHSYQSAEETRKILAKYGIDKNAFENGVALSEKIHSGLHTYKYMDEVLEVLRIADMTKSKDKVIEALKSIAEEIKSGTFLN